MRVVFADTPLVDLTRKTKRFEKLTRFERSIRLCSLDNLVGQRVEAHKGINSRMIVYLVSPTSILKDYVEIEVRKMQIDLQVYESIGHFLSHHEELSPGHVILTVKQYDSRATDFLDRILKRNKNTQVILSVCDWNVKDIVHAIQYGFADFLDVTIESERTGAILSKLLERDQVSRADTRSEIPQSVLDALNPQEIELFRLIIHGRTTKEVSVELDLSVRTVHYRKSAIFGKLGIRSRNDAFEMVRKIRHDSHGKFPRPHFQESRQNVAIENSESCP